MDTKRKGIEIFIAVILVISVLALSMPAVAKDPPPTPSGSIDITNDIIWISGFGETGSWSWYYPPTSADHLFSERFAVKDGGNPTVWSSAGDITQYYPDTGSPDTCYQAVIEIDLDGDGVADIRVTRTVMVPSGGKFFYVKYRIENIKGSAIDDFKFYQGADYDVETGLTDEGGYDASDFVWSHDLDDTGITHVGFKSNIPSSHHTASHYSSMWGMIANDNLNDNNYYSGDVGVALEWDLGQLNAGSAKELTLKFAFADSYGELADILSTVDPLVCPTTPVPTLTPIGLIALVGLLSIVAAISISTSIRKKRR